MPLTARNGEHYVAHVLPLTSGERRRAGAGYAAVAALFVRKAELDAPSRPEAIARLYKLTPTELRVLLAVVQVGGVPEVADALGVGKATVGPTCSACSARPIPSASPTWSSWWQGSPVPSSTDRHA